MREALLDGRDLRERRKLNILWAALALYLVTLHGVVAALIVAPDWAGRLNRRLLPRVTEWQPTPFWNEMVGVHLRLDPTAEGAVFFLGDSLTQSLNVGTIVADGVNYGIGSDAIAGVRRRISLYRSLATARAIVVAIGLNDLRNHEAPEVGQTTAG